MLHVLRGTPVAGVGVRRIGQDLLEELRTLVAEPPLHLLQSEVRRSMYCEHHHAARVLVVAGRVLGEARTFANHPILEVPDLNDAIPGGPFVLCQLKGLGLEQIAVHQRCAGRQEHPQFIGGISALQIPPTGPCVAVGRLELASDRTLLEVVEGLTGGSVSLHETLRVGSERV